jgi:hypothetical protein
MTRGLRSRFVLLLLFVAAASSAALALEADGVSSDESSPEPVALRRVLLSPERVAAEMERAQQGLLVQLTRAEFEERIKNAALAGQIVKNPPRLIEARYTRVKVKDGALVGGAEWKLLNPTAAPALMSVQSPSFALRQARWADGKAALLGDLDGKDLSLLVEGQGERVLFLEWSARGSPVSGGQRYSLDLPPCAVATLELELHKDYTVALSREAGVLTGPLPAEQADHHTWRIAFAGRNQLNFEVRRTRGPDLATPLVLHQLQSVQELAPGQTQAAFDFTVEVLHGAVKELRFECSPGLRPYEVNVRNLDSWKLLPGPGPNDPSILVIQTREPFEGGPVHVRGLAPLASDQPWVSPGVRLLNSVSRGETLEVRIDPELQMMAWKSAGFRLVRSAFLPDGKQVLTLTLGLDSGANPERPSAVIPVSGPEYKVTWRTWWQLAPDRPTLTTYLTCEVMRGRLFRLPLLVPPGYDVEQVEPASADLLRHWSVTKEKPTLVLELSHGLEPGASARLTIRLRATQPLTVSANGTALPFPDLMPAEARLREGTFALSVVPFWLARVNAPLAATAPEVVTDAEPLEGPKPPQPRMRVPWGKQVPDYYFAFKGQAVEGTLQLRPRQGRLRALCLNDIALASGRGLARYQVELNPEVTAPDFVDLFIAGPAVERWYWRTVQGTNEVKRVEPLPARNLLPALSLLGARHPIQAAALAAVPPPRGHWWRLTFARPLREPLTIQASIELPGGWSAAWASAAAVLGSPHVLGVLPLADMARRETADGGEERRWEVPIVTVPDAGRREALVTLYLTGADFVRVEKSGLEDGSDAAARDNDGGFAPAKAFAWRTYRCGSQPLALTLWGRVPAADRSAEPVIDRAVLTSQLGTNGELRHRFGFQLWQWHEQTVPVRLPAGARLLQVSCNGAWLGTLPRIETPEGEGQIDLPAAGPGPLQFELVYTTDVSAWTFWTRLEAPKPGLPLVPLVSRHIWRLPAGVVPGTAGAFRRVEATSAEARPLPWLSELFAGQAGWGEGETLFDSPATGESEWEAIAGTNDAVLPVVRQSSAPLAGMVLAGLLIGFAVRVCRLPGERRGRRFLLGWLAVSGLALLWLPPVWRGLAWWPTLAAVLTAVVFVARLAWARAALPRPTLSGTVLAPLVLAVVLTAAGEAAAPGPVTVYLIADPEKPEKQTVLAPPDLLDQLQALSRRGVPALRGAVALSGEYEGKADLQSAQLEARYRVYCFGDEPAVLTLPLGGVQLTEALIDGASTQPVAVRQPHEGYTVELKGRGSHNLLFRFAVPLTVTGEDRDLRFAIPELPQSRLLLSVPASAGYLHVPEARGWQHTSREDKTARLEADLGKVGSVRVRWRRDGTEPRGAAVSVQEAYYWDLQTSTSRLLAVLQYTVNKGSETSFRLDLPRELEVRSAEATPFAGGPPAPRLRWQVKEEGPARRLHLDFQAPVTGGVQVTLELVPRQPFGRTVVLPFPTPLDVQLGQSFLAYRTEGVEASVANHHAITGIERDQLAKTFEDSFAQPWRSARQDDPRPPTRAFWRGKGGVLHLILRAPPAPVRCRQDVTWQVGPRQAGLRATATVTGLDNVPLSFVEWEVPGGLALAEVSGPNVRSWTASGSRLLVWLQKPVNETTVQLSGWLPRPREGGRFDLPLVRVEGRSLATTLRVAGDGLILKPGALSNLTFHPDPSGTSRDWNYSSDQDNYGGSFATVSAAPRAELRLLTFAEIRDQRLTFVTTLDAQVSRGELRHLVISVRNWEGKDLRLDAPLADSLHEQHPRPGDTVWFLELRPGAKEHYQLTVTGSAPLGSLAELLLPDVRVETTDPGSIPVERWVAVAGSDLAAEDASGLAARADGPALLTRWPREAERLRRAGGQVWEVKADDWRLRLRPRAPKAPAPVQVLGTEHAAAVADGQRWVYQSTFRLSHEAGAELNLALPKGIEVLALTLNGERVPPLLAEPDHLWLPLRQGRGSCVLCLTWAPRAGKSETGMDLVPLEGPRLSGIANGPVVWTVHVPDGYDVKSPPRGERVETANLERLRTTSAGTSFTVDLAPFPRGRSYSWQSVDGDALYLVSHSTQESRQALAWSMLLLMLLLALWALAHFFRATWPEQLALLGCLAALLLSPVFLLLPAGAIGYRLFGIVRWGLRLVHVKPVPEATAAP